MVAPFAFFFSKTENKRRTISRLHMTSDLKKGDGSTCLEPRGRKLKR
jgi:hypothetical protein